MRKTQTALGKYKCGMVALLVIALAGGWLILAPFALGYQPYGADWTSQTVNDFVMGISVAVVGLASFTLFFYSLLGALRAAGVLISRPRPEPQVPAQHPPMAAEPQASALSQSDLDRTLATLAAALAADLNARRQAGSDQKSDQPVDQFVNRSET